MSSMTPFASLTMTSREIAELTGKEHKNVLRDIDNLLKTLGSDLSLGFSMTYEGDPANGYRIYHLDRDSTLCLISGYDANARMRIIKRWQALESGEAIPAFTLTPSPIAKPPQINQQAKILADTFGSMTKIARLCGLKGNQAVLSADRGTHEWIGVSPLKILGVTHLNADQLGRIYTPTDLGEMLVPPIKGAAMNRLLETHGLQTRDTTGEWIPTAAAEGLYEWSDTHKRHSNGTPIKQLRWFVAVLDRLGVEYRINGGDE